MRIFFSDEQLKYNPKNEFSGHDFRQYPEKPDRINWILQAIEKEKEIVVDNGTSIKKTPHKKP